MERWARTKQADVTERDVNVKVRVMGTEHIKGMPEINNFFVAVPSPVCVGVREMVPAGAVYDAVFQTVTDLMSARGGRELSWRRPGIILPAPRVQRR